MKYRRKITINAWAITRIRCWITHHVWQDVYPGDAFSRYHQTCARCLVEQYPPRG